MNKLLTKLPNQPTNVIFTGVAGTGKTHRLLAIQKLYDESIDAPWAHWRLQQLSHYGWCDVVCTVLLLENRMMTVPEMMRHPLIQDKAAANKRNDNLNQTVWVQLNKHAHPDSVTVNTTQRSANYYFDKTESSQWFLLDEVIPTLKDRLADLMSLYDESSQQQYAEQHVVSRSSLVSFHQSYGYDEFVEGIRPRINPQTGQMQYEIQPGAFLSLCAKASADPEHRYAMLIDEINRANTAQVFGELMSVIEPSKRAGSSTPMTVRLTYSGQMFSVPSNVDIYATMNTQDQSLTVLDTAFRRRFDFITCYPDSSVVDKIKDNEGNEIDLAQMMRVINQRLTGLLGNEAQLGQSYFMNITTAAELAKRLYQQIIPQIMEYAKHSVSLNQTTEILVQVLYGISTESLLEAGTASLFANTEVDRADTDTNSSEHANRLQYGYQQPLVSESVTLADDFIEIASGIDSKINENREQDISTNAEESAKKINIYLTAALYQQMYR